MESVDPRSVGFDAERLARLGRAIQADIDAERYDGCEVVVGRHGRIALHERFGYAERAARRPIARDQVFVSMSIAKQLTGAVVHARIERGDFSLTTQVADLIPEFAQKGKAHVTIGHLLTHTSGIVSIPLVPPDQLGSLEAAIAAICASPLESAPGARVVYSILAGHAVLAECVRRAEGGKRPFRQIVHEELLEPLGMRDTSLGARPDLRARMAPVVVRDRSPGLLDADFLEGMNALLGPESEIPAGGYLTTARDMHRFAEMLRGGGALEGARVLSPATVRALQQNRTGTQSNSIWDYALAVRGWQPWPAFLGLGFFLRGEGTFPTPFGQLASPRTFGGFGAGSTAFWIDPERDLTYAFLSTGLLEESRSLERHQRLADLVHAALVD
jgi:CubicO group peptidase (beta-lactamase class C family)